MMQTTTNIDSILSNLKAGDHVKINGFKMLFTVKCANGHGAELRGARGGRKSLTRCELDGSWWLSYSAGGYKFKGDFVDYAAVA